MSSDPLTSSETKRDSESGAAKAAVAADPNLSRRAGRFVLRALLALLCLVAVWSFLWPVYRAFYKVQIDENEGWNGYYADAALGRMPLYPDADQWITNNYPPLSFFIVGGLAKIVGDTVLAGRLLSLAAVLAITAAVALSIRRLGGDRPGAIVGAAFFLAAMSRFHVRYVGMNDPQLLAEAFMSFGFFAFLRSTSRNEGCLGAFLLMVFAGFVKHNIVAMPLTAVVWLAFRRPRELLRSGAASVAAITFGFALCFAFFGRDFFVNFFSPRTFSWEAAVDSLPTLRCLGIAFAAFLWICCARRHDPRVQLVAILVGLGFSAFFLEKTGAGVDENAGFDLVIGLSIGVGLAFTLAPTCGCWIRPSSDAVRILLLLALCFELLHVKKFKRLLPVRMLFDPSLKKEIAVREQAMADSVEEVRGAPGDVLTSNLVAYWSGKPFVVDRFNVTQRVLAGKLSAHAFIARSKHGPLTEIVPDASADWDNPIPKR